MIKEYKNKMTVLEIRRIKSTDRIGYFDVLSQLRSVEKSSDIDFARFVTEEVNDSHMIFVAVLEERIIAGTITVFMKPRMFNETTCTAYVYDLVVDKYARKNGIGTILLSKAVDICRKMGYYKVHVTTTNDNIDFYKKNGFMLDSSPCRHKERLHAVKVDFCHRETPLQTARPPLQRTLILSIPCWNEKKLIRRPTGGADR